MLSIIIRSNNDNNKYNNYSTTSKIREKKNHMKTISQNQGVAVKNSGSKGFKRTENNVSNNSN